MNIYPPVKKASRFGWYHELTSLLDFNNCVGQRFGENQLDYSTIGLIGHNGIDVQIPNGAEIIASHDGIVDVVSNDPNAGKGVTIKGKGLKTVYWHFMNVSVSAGQQVKTGDLLGLGDNTGWSTGPHLHFGMKLLDDNNEVIDRNNGYDGAVDPLPYIIWFKTMTEKDVKSLQALEGYHDPDGVQYWTGKPLETYLKARLADKVKTIQEIEDE